MIDGMGAGEQLFATADLYEAGVVEIDGEKYMVDDKGRRTPLAMVKPQEKLEDQMVRKIIFFAEALSAQIDRFRGHCFDDIGAFMALLSEQYGATRGGKKGNMTFTSYDGRLKVQVQISDQMTFGPELQVAKDLIDECINEWSAGSRDEIRALVDHAFEPRKEGIVNREAIFSLRRVEIDDDRWKRAMDAIGDSIRVQGSKTYIRFYKRPDPNALWEAVTIDMASARAPKAGS